jgi:hypothetical protein
VARRPGDALDDAIRRAFALLELHRHEAFALTRSKRPATREEGLFLMAAIDRLERYLHVAEELSDSEAARLWVEDVLADWTEPRRRRRGRGRFSAGSRQKARVRARARFEAIAADVMAGLEDALSNLPSHEAGAEPERCVAPTRRGTRCMNRAVANGLCEMHARLANDPLVAPEPAASRSPAFAPTAGDRVAVGANDTRRLFAVR